MNHVYQVVWNEATQSVQAVCELSGSTRKKGKSKQSRHAARTVALALAGVVSSAALAQLPSGGTIAAGTGSIAVNGNTMTINQATPKLVTNWQSFNVGAGKTVEFVQPSSSASALNRVTGADVSTIQGSIKSNGQVFLVNPNGVLFTPTAQVNVGGLVASTLDVANDDFLAGRLRFNGSSTASVINQGQIKAADGGMVALVAARIVNTGNGQITADKGQVLMAAGSDVTLDLGGPVKVRVSEGALNALIEQGAAIQADGGLVYLTAKAAGDLAATVINHTGITRARTLATGEGGSIYLMGGMTKDRIQVGGRLDASAPAGGAGGFIETSAAQVQIADDVRVDTRAPNGQAGNWLIDPNDYWVRSSGGNITGAALGAQLDTTNVTIQTTTQGNSGGNGDIYIYDAVAKSAGSASNTTLTLLAERNVYIAKSMSGAAGSPLNLVISARANGEASGNVEIWGGLPASVNSSSSTVPYATILKTYGGNVAIGGGDATASGYAIRSNGQAGVRVYNGAVIDASSDGGATLSVSNVNNWQGNNFYQYASAASTSGSGGDITIRGKGDSTAVTYNWGVQIQNGSLATAGAGKVSIEGEGGNGGSAATAGNTNSWNVGSIGVLLERSANVLAKDGNITITGRAGSGYDRYGVASTESNKQIKTAGYLKIDGDSLLIRDGTLTLDVGRDSDIKTPIVSCSVAAVGCDAYTLTKQGAGILNLWGDAQAWDAARPANTRATATSGVFNDTAGKVNLILPGADLSTLNAATEGAKKLYAFSTLPPSLQLAMLNASSATPLMVYYVRPTAGSSVYGDAPAPVWSIYDDSAAGNLISNVGAQGNANWSGVTTTTGVGSYTVSYAGGLTTSTPGTFLMPGTAANWQVTRRPVSVTLSGIKYYEEADPASLASSYSATTVNNDTLNLSGNLTRQAGELPGRYAINVNPALMDAGNPNYSVSVGNSYFYVQTDILRTGVSIHKNWGQSDPSLAQIEVQFLGRYGWSPYTKMTELPWLTIPNLVRASGERAGIYKFDSAGIEAAFIAANPNLLHRFIMSGDLTIDQLPGLLPGLVSRVFPLNLPKFNFTMPKLTLLGQHVKVSSTGVKHSIKKIALTNKKFKFTR